MTSPERIGRYRIERVLGQGGMGIVYAARDEQLGRAVAVKTILSAGDGDLQKRFWREARAAACVNHPNVCQIYEVGEAEGVAFLVMELLEGEALCTRLERGPVALPEALKIGLGVLSALEALHRSEVVHRDLKPSNIFLTPHGVKVLDFGLARQTALSSEATASFLTQPGTLLGTPRYMSPEQLRGEEVDARSDLFTLGAILFEMLSGRVALPGRTTAEIFHATLYEQPPALAGSPAIAAVDLVIRRALAKKASDRHATAASMADDLRGISVLEDSGVVPRARAMTRLIVLPFRMLRPDPEVDFLAFSVPDAVTSALAGLESLVVRSSLVAQRFGADALDLQRLASEADVDLALSGSLLRSGEQIRVAAQLVEAPGGALVWSHSATLPLTDVFRLQDDLVTRLVESLSIPLTAREHRMLQREVARSPSAYELYLRANRLATEAGTWEVAQQLYERCLQEDPTYAPAWARLGRVYRLQAKYRSENGEENFLRAEKALQRALELHPDSALAHNLYTHFEVETGRATDAMVRLLGRARHGTADPDLFAGLVTATRYCGLMQASLAADRHARRLDAAARTSVSYTHWMLGDYAQAAALDPQDADFMGVFLATVRGGEDAMAAVRKAREATPLPLAKLQHGAYLAALEGRREEALDSAQRLFHSTFRDPEGLFFIGRVAGYLGAREEALAFLEHAMEAGFWVPAALRSDPWWDPRRGDSKFHRLVQRAEEKSRSAARAFRDAEGDRILGVAE